MDITTLEYPRHLHKPERAYLHVDSAEEAAQALADGWSVDPAVGLLSGAVMTDRPPDPVVPAPRVPDVAPVKGSKRR